MLMLRRIFPAIYAVVLSSLLAFVALAVLQFNQIHSGMEREKIGILASRVAAPFEAATAIGLPLSSVRNAGVLLERARQLDRSIAGVFLFDADGTLVISAAAQDADAPFPGAIPRAGSASPGVFSGETDQGRYAGVRLAKAGGDFAGAVVIAYSAGPGASPSWSIVGKLLLAGLLFGLATVPLLWIAMRRVLRGAIRDYDEIESQLREAERQSWLLRDAPGAVAEPDQPRSLGAMSLAADARYRDAAQRAEASADDHAPSVDMPPPPRLRGRLSLTLSAFLTVAVLGFSGIVLFAFEQAIKPELESRATVVAELVRSEMQRALELGIPISALGGLSSYVETILQDFREISGIAILRPDGEPIIEAAQDKMPASLGSTIGSALGAAIGIQAGAVDLPMLAGNDVVGTVRITGSEIFVQTRLRDVFLDVFILSIAMLLIGIEIAVAAVGASVWKSHAQMIHLLEEQRRGVFLHVMRERGPEIVRRVAARLNAYARDLAARGGAERPAPTMLSISEVADMRLPLFFFVLGSEITASFLPILAGASARPAWLSENLAAAAPLIVYLVSVGALSPFGGVLSRRFGARSLFVGAVPIALAALVWMALADSVTAIALARGLVAAAYALATVAAQEYALHADPAAPRVRTMNVIVSLILGGTFCGSVIGGVIASRLGFPAAILVGAAFILAAGLTGWFGMNGSAGAPLATVQRRVAGARGQQDMPGLVGVMVGLAMPLSAVTAAFIWYYVPVTLNAEGQRTADIARVVMLYYLVAILLGPVLGALGRHDRLTRPSALAGSCLAGLSLLALLAGADIWTMAFVVLSVGTGHALLRSPIYALTLELGGSSTRPVAILRLVERAGALMGLVLAASLNNAGLLGSLGPVMGLAVLGGGLLFLGSNTARKRQRRERQLS